MLIDLMIADYYNPQKVSINPDYIVSMEKVIDRYHREHGGNTMISMDGRINYCCKETISEIKQKIADGKEE